MPMALYNEWIRKETLRIVSAPEITSQGVINLQKYDQEMVTVPPLASSKTVHSLNQIFDNGMCDILLRTYDYMY